MTDYLLSPIELYMKKSLKLLILLTTLCAFCASITFTVLKLVGLYPTVSMPTLIAFDIFDCLCFILGRVLSNKCITKDGVFHRDMMLTTKILIAVLVVMQWNFITYMIPSRDFWAYSSLFVLLSIFYVDHIYTLAIESGIGVSMIIGWVIKGEELAPVKDEYYVSNLILRIVLVVLVFAFLWFVTYFTQKFLVKPMEIIADYDPLTGLRNRRTMYKLIETALNKNRSLGRSVTILLCDIDDFKNVNDTYGHDCGDLVLKRVAENINAVLSDNGVAFRYGGEEFVIMVDAAHSVSLNIAEHIRQSISDMEVMFNDCKVKITITLGAADSDIDGNSIDGLISIADSRMYKGKLSGKNKVFSTDN